MRAQPTDETGEIRLDTGIVAAGRQPAAPGNSETYNRWPREVVQRRAEVGAGSSSGDGEDNTTSPERRTGSQVCS
jgi:hypothetical protein